MSTMTPSEIAGALEARHKYDKINYPPASPLDRQAAATIRAQAEALKIATEALKGLHSTIANAFPALSGSEPMVAATQALARIKEAGQ